jgi:acetylornithine deacetylase/succinyl-diaminopimelate desuccinylase-like protein
VQNAHKPDESIALEELVEATAVYKGVIRRLLATPQDRRHYDAGGRN